MSSENNEINKTFECPFSLGQIVYYTYPLKRLFRKDKWIVRKSRIIEFWVTNTFGVCLDDSNHIPEDWFYRLFTDKDEAVEFCLKKNQRLTVKIY
jgi:hypothetical protein